MSASVRMSASSRVTVGMESRVVMHVSESASVNSKANVSIDAYTVRPKDKRDHVRTSRKHMHIYPGVQKSCPR